MGMFTTRDPIGLMGGDNVFAYAPNPTGWVDPLGLKSIGYTKTDIMDYLKNGQTKIKPEISGTNYLGPGPKGPAKFSPRQINSIWTPIIEKHTAQVLKTGKMTKCPDEEPTACTKCAEGTGGWKKYGGFSIVFHCGFDGYLENRIPGDNNNHAPANECFYDDDGELVTESHDYGGCRGTPDYFPYFGTGTDADNARRKPHATIDAGGPQGPSKTHNNLGDEALAESYKYQQDKIDERNRIMIESMPPGHRHR